MSCAPHPLSASFLLFIQSGTTDHLQEVQISDKPIVTQFQAGGFSLHGLI